MPTQWLFLSGAPSLQQILSSGASGHPHRHETAAATGDAWQVRQPTPALVSTAAAAVIESGVIEDNEDLDRTQESTNQDAAAIQSVLLERSRALTEESQAGRRLLRPDVSRSRNLRNEETQAETQSQNALEGTQDSYWESILPPPTQRERRGSRKLGDTTKSFRSVGNITEEQSIINLPSWSFLMSSITALDHLPPSSSPDRAGNVRSPRVNLLALIHELELPSTMPVKNKFGGRPGAGRHEVTRAGMTLMDTSGTTLQVVMWDDYAEEWAGRHLMQGDVVYVEKLALSEYKGQRQGSTIDGSKVQVCYRTAQSLAGQTIDQALRPDLSLAWDQVSQHVKRLVQLASDILI